MTDVIIIGAGPAGLTAAIYAIRFGFSVIVFEGMFYGGQVASTPEVENYPSIDRITGIDFSVNLYNQASNIGTDIRMENVEAVDLKGDIKTVTTNAGEYKSKTVIICNGAKRRKLGCVGEDEFSGRGVSYCATCDGAFFKGMEVAIVGGGNTALEDALFLSNICRKVYVVHRRNEFRGMNILVKAILDRENIEILYNSKVESILGEEKVSSVKIVNTDGEIRELDISGIFVAIGLEPDNKIFSKEISLDKYGYIVSGEECKTNVEGVFVAGDSRTKVLRQIVTATADGAIAAFEAANYINLKE